PGPPADEPREHAGAECTHRRDVNGQPAVQRRKTRRDERREATTRADAPDRLARARIRLDRHDPVAHLRTFLERASCWSLKMAPMMRSRSRFEISVNAKLIECWVTRRFACATAWTGLSSPGNSRSTSYSSSTQMPTGTEARKPPALRSMVVALNDS